MNKIKCIIVDDEPLALKLIESYVVKTPFLQLIANCNNAIEVLKILEEEEIDLIFLDIEMPNLNGIELSKIINSSTKIIFTTAYEKYAIEGYKVNALDYLLKPFDYNEFLDSALKAKNIINETKLNKSKKEKYILIKANYKVQQILLKEIQYIEGVKDYVKIFMNSDSKTIMSLMSMKSLEEKLSINFMRVHRSYIVNLNEIKTIDKSRIVFGKTYIPISPKYKEEFQIFINSRSVQ